MYSGSGRKPVLQRLKGGGTAHSRSCGLKGKKNTNIHVCVFFSQSRRPASPPSYCRNGAYYARPSSEVGAAAKNVTTTFPQLSAYRCRQSHDEKNFNLLRPAPLSGSGQLLSKSLYSALPRRKTRLVHFR